MGKVGYHARLKDLHRSNPFSSGLAIINDEQSIPDAWYELVNCCRGSTYPFHLRLSKEVLDSPLSYTRGRDIHSVGVVFLQMLHGQGVIYKFNDPREALQAGMGILVNRFSSSNEPPAASISPTLQVTGLNMLSSSKRSQVSCLSLLADLASMSLTIPTRTNTPSIPVPGPGALTGNGNRYGTSPDKDYFRVPPSTRQASRWKEDWEELELLVRNRPPV